MKKINKICKYLLLFALIAIIIMAGMGFWLYSGSLTPLKEKFFNCLPLPMATVNGQGIPMKDFTFRYNLAQKLGIAQNDSQTRQNIYSQMVTDTEIAQLAKSHDIFVSQKQLDENYNAALSQANSGNGDNFENLLNSYGLSKTDYENKILLPPLLLVNLKIWFYSQTNLNQTEYTLANSLLQQIKNGADMGTIAKQYGQDSAEQSVQGDLGYVQLTNILPELWEPVDEMNIGDVKIFSSRYGLHIIKLEQKTGNLYHLREIFIQGADFNQWFNLQTQNFKIKKLLQI